MIFIVLGKFRKKPTKETVAATNKALADASKAGMKAIATYWTLGSYDAVAVFEAPDEKTVMKNLMRISDSISTETLVAMSREDATKLVE